MPAFPPAPPDGSGVVIVTLSTGLELQAEWIDTNWWAHLNDNPNAAPIDSAYVVAWRPAE